MLISQYNYAVLGGDLRQVYLAKKLAECGASVTFYALCRSPIAEKLPFLTESNSLKESIEHAQCIIGPIPFCKKDTLLNQNVVTDSIPVQDILSHIKSGQLFCAGGIPENFQQTARQKGVFVFDFLQDISLAYFNTIATAEGVICEAIKKSPINLQKSKCAVLGYGKCGQRITDYLKRFYCHVTVVATPETELAKGALTGDLTMTVDEFFHKIPGYDFIFNTIPLVILTKEHLSRCNPSVTILDIASHPGGVDWKAAKELCINAHACPGLPGRYAPASSANAIFDSLKKAEKRLERSSLCL